MPALSVVWAFLRPFLPYIAGAVALVAAILWIDHRGYQRGFHRRDAEIAAMQAAAARQEALNAERVRQASDAYAAKVSAMQPIIVRSIDKVQTYAQTPAGRAECLGADRVSSILQDRAALAAAAESGSGLLQSSPDTSPSANKR